MITKIKTWNKFKLDEFMFIIIGKERYILSYPGSGFTGGIINMPSSEVFENHDYLRLDISNIKKWNELDYLGEKDALLILNPEAILEFDDEKYKVKVRTNFADSAWMTLFKNSEADEFMKKICERFKEYRNGSSR